MTYPIPRFLAAIGFAISLATTGPVVAQGTATLTGTTGNTCTYTSAAVSPNGNINITCSGGGGGATATIAFGTPSGSLSSGINSGVFLPVSCTGDCAGAAVTVSTAAPGVTVGAPASYTWTAAGSNNFTINGAAPLTPGTATITLQVTAAATGASVTTTPALNAFLNTNVTIANDSAPGSLQFTAASAAVNENTGNYNLTVSRTGAGAAAPTVGVTVNCTPSAGYTPAISPPSGSGLGWTGADASSKTVTINVTALPSSANGSVTCALSNPTGGATLGTNSTFTLTVNKVVVAGQCPATNATIIDATGNAARQYAASSAGGSTAIKIRGPFTGLTYANWRSVGVTGYNTPQYVETNITTCPGDFSTRTLDYVTGASQNLYCNTYDFGENFQFAFWAGGGSYPGFCNLDPAKTYYVNVRFPNCIGTCGVAIDQ